MTEVWALPGYDVQALIGFGATGEVWRARELSTGDTVALKRLRDGVDPKAVESLRREAPVLRSLDTPYVVRLRAVLGEGAETVLVLDHAPGGSLAALLTRRGSLDPAEVVTVAAPLAQALAAAHACGLVHGDVTPANILFTADGMPLLADLGLSRLTGGGASDEAADVWALAAVCHHMLSGAPPDEDDSVDVEMDAAQIGARAPLGLLAPAAPRALVSAIEQALQADTAFRPDAAAFASALRRSHAAAPVRLLAPAPAPGPEPRPARVVHGDEPPTAVTEPSTPDHRRLLIAGAAVGLVVVAALAGWLSGRSGPVQLVSVEAATPGPAVAPPKVAAAASWQSILDALDRARAAAFANADAAALTAVYAPHSRLLVADRDAIAGMGAGQRARGVRHTIRSLTVTSHNERVAVLRVVDELAACELVDASGRVIMRIPPRAPATHVVRIVNTPAGWRLADITTA